MGINNFSYSLAPKRQDDKDSIPLGLSAPGDTAEAVNGAGGWRVEGGGGLVGRGGGGGAPSRGLIQKINPMEFSPHCKWRFAAFAAASADRSGTGRPVTQQTQAAMLDPHRGPGAADPRPVSGTHTKAAVSTARLKET